MKLGLITDIHEHVPHLRTALERFQREGVDQVVMIGDVFEMGDHIEETCCLLSAAGAIGVWGNHDFGISAAPTAEMREKYSPVVIDFMTSLRPALDVEGCYFCHIEPWLDPTNLMDLWYFEGPPDTQGKLDRIFAAVPSRLVFAGHYHKWLLATPQSVTPWCGEVPVRLTDSRYFVVVSALCEGRYATLDTDSWELIPFQEHDTVVQASKRGAGF